MATLRLEKMHLSAIIGTQPHERNRRQTIVLNIEFDYDSHAARKSDKLEDAVDYLKMSESICKVVAESSFFLLEKLADAIVGIILSFNGVSRGKVSITKFGVIPETETVTIILEEHRKNWKLL